MCKGLFRALRHLASSETRVSKSGPIAKFLESYRPDPWCDATVPAALFMFYAELASSHLHSNASLGFQFLQRGMRFKFTSGTITRQSMDYTGSGRSGNMHWSPALRTRSGVVGRGYGVETDCRMEYCT
ncbi:hypothetical protein J6590_100826 [Homalodisca vitripennis]|nr:hypothetical protein J6590_100826 [Homalodisca vitripennis]